MQQPLEAISNSGMCENFQNYIFNKSMISEKNNFFGVLCTIVWFEPLSSVVRRSWFNSGFDVDKIISEFALKEYSTQNKSFQENIPKHRYKIN